MSQHISRKELKQDKIAETFVHGVEAVESHLKQAWMIGGAVLVIVLAVFGWRFYSERQTVKATAALEEAMKIFSARIRTAGEPEEPGEITYVEDKFKYMDAAKKFSEVANSYSLTRPGQVARYYAGLSYEQVGNYAEAKKWLGEVESSRDAEMAALARFQLAKISAQTGADADAVKLYQALIAKPTTMLPKQVSMMALADYYAKKNPAEAVKLYTQVKTEFPDTAASDQAEQRLLELKPKS
ncbi:MAG: tetratricopeptide repeat protein [Acidobacteria bacterium]|nr:tetratricopeptide repeat protein [Acidobacteriota bacterium]MBI3664038.1 tetratricopeptide repeat protein [Acidobacteriota bacterium]